MHNVYILLHMLPDALLPALQLKELESSLFGSLAHGNANFGREAEEQAERLPSRAFQVVVLSCNTQDILASYMSNQKSMTIMLRAPQSARVRHLALSVSSFTCLGHLK